MKGKFFVKDFFVYALNSILLKIFSFVMVFVVVRVFTVEEFGAIDTMIGIVALIDILIGLGYDISLKKRVLIDSKTEENKKDYLTTIFWFIVVWGAIIISTMLLFKNQLSLSTFGTNDYLNVFIFGVISCYTNSLIGLFLNIARVEFKRIKFLAISVSKTLIEYALIVVVVSFFKKDPSYYFISIVIAESLIFLILLFLNRNKLNGKFKKELLKNILTFGIPASISGIGYWVFSISDKILISNITGGTEQTAIYSMIIKMLSIYTFLISSFKQAWIPRAFQMYNDDKEKFCEKLNKVHIYTLVIFSTIAIFNFAGLRLMIDVFATEEYLVGLKIAYPLIIAYIIYPLTNIASIGLYVSDNMKKLSNIVWIAAVINIVINIFFIKSMGIVAASISTLAAYLFMYIFYFRTSCKALGWKIDWKKPITVFTLIVILVLSIHFVNIPNVFIDLFVKLVISCIYVILMFVFKIVDLDYFKMLVKDIFYKNKKVS